MCDMCYGYIYDTLVNPLPVDHLLNGYLHKPSLLKCAGELADCFQRALNIFDNHPHFFINYSMENHMNIINEKNPKVVEFLEDEWAWSNFLVFYPEGAKEITYASQICLEHSITRKVSLKEQFIQHFLMDRLRILLSCIPAMHKQHTEKIPYDNVKSPGPASFVKIANLRASLGLPPSIWEKEQATKLMEKEYFNLYI